MRIVVRDYVVPLATPGKPCGHCGMDAKAYTKRGIVCWYCYLAVRLEMSSQARARFTTDTNYVKIEGQSEYESAAAMLTTSRGVTPKVGASDA